MEDPFAVPGLDFAVTFMVTLNYRTTQKVKDYFLLFTHAVTRAVQFETVIDLSINSLINAFRRFITLKFCPRTMYSDNAATCIAAG